MPAPPLLNNLDGGTSGVAISAGNSGPPSGNPFSAVTGTLCLFDNARSHSFANAMSISPVSSAVQTVQWTGLGSILTSVWARSYLYFPALPNANCWVMRFDNNAAGRCCDIRVTTAGKIEASVAAGGAMAGSLGTVTIPLNQWFRLEYRVVASTTVGVCEWRLYSEADSLAITETKLVTGQVLAANIDGIKFGMPDTPTPTAGTFYWDDMAVGSQDWLGPSQQPQPQPARPLMLALQRFRPVFFPIWVPKPVYPDIVFAAGPVSETPTPGGVIVAGNGPVAVVPVSPGGAIVDGTSPSPRAAPAAGGAIVGGSAPVARVDVASGGGQVGGVGPVARASVAIGGAIVGGASPTAQATATPIPGGAIVGGTAPTAQAATSPGGVIVGGVAPTARTTFSPGGVNAGGSAPTASASVSTGGALVGGTGPAALVPVTTGAVIVGGQLTDPLSGGVSETPPPGGVIVGGVSATARASVAIGGSIVGGTGPVARTTLSPGGATVSGTPPAPSESAPIGGVNTGGFGPATRVTFAPGGVVVGGVAPSDGAIIASGQGAVFISDRPVYAVLVTDRGHGGVGVSDRQAYAVNTGDRVVFKVRVGERPLGAVNVSDSREA